MLAIFNTMNLVWLKRDLRTQDHSALKAAVSRGPTIALFIFEPCWFKSAEYDPHHLRFVFESLKPLRDNLAELGVPLLTRTGSALDVLTEVKKHFPFQKIFSHEETGLDWTFKRDLAIEAWAQTQSVEWVQLRQFGVVRRLKNRDHWARERSKIIERPLLSPWGQSRAGLEKYFSDFEFELPEHLLLGASLSPLAQKGGAPQAQKTLTSFLESRGRFYFNSLSSPSSALNSCSRLSPYLSWGCLSMTEVHHAVQKRKQQIQREEWDKRKNWGLSLKQFESRLWWHCHFIQKLESEPEIEFRNFNREFDQMRESEFCETKFQAWCKGETGFPLVDACMRALHQQRWINFRMRALLVSFASYQLWLHWKRPAEYLARLFLDFEPGIHYSQMQMQSGVTGINTIRIYSPQKQLIDQDPQGEFVKKWIPELAETPFETFTGSQDLPPLLQLSPEFQAPSAYPKPIVDPKESYQAAKEKIFKWRAQTHVRKASQKVLQKHGSRKGPHFPLQNRD